MAGKYSAYTEYKDSGLEWQDEIPRYWKRLKFKFFANQGKVFASGPFGSSIGSQFYRDEGVPVIRGNNLSLNGDKPKYVDDGYVFLDEDKANDLSNAEVILGDLVFTARGTVGQVGLIPTDGTIKWERAILSANQLRYRNKNSEMSADYLWYLFSSWMVRTQILLSSDSVAQPNLNLGSLKNLHLLCPEYDEQQKIANFLDHETAKIDTLIEKQQQLIKLLKEKRQAVISHAVTKGISYDGHPNAPMKDSGVEWFDKLPNHWRIIELKFSAKDGRKTFTDGDWIESPFITDSGVRLLQTGNVGIGEFKEKGFRYVSENTFKQLNCTEVSPGNVLICRLDGPVGRSCLAPDLGVKVITSVDNAILKPNDEFDPRYIVYLTNCTPWLEWIADLCRVGGGFRLRVSRTMLGDQRIPAPPIEEQIRIADKLDTLSDHSLECMARCEESMKLLRERRTALISAVVTGKIDVRNWRAPETLNSNNKEVA